jgi:alpha-1,3-rhamnosyltransferase
MHSPLVNIIVPCYNHQEYIEECLLSILNQDYQNILIFVTDDFSSDNTKKILKEKFESNSKIRIFYNEKNLGLDLSLLKMINSSEGEYIAFLSGDDYWIDKSKISKQVEWFNLNKNGSICFSGVFKKLVTGELSNIDYNFDSLNNEKNIFKQLYFLGESYSSFMVKRKFIDKSPFPESINIFTDWYFMICIAIKGDVGGIKDVTTVYRKHNNSLSSLNSDKMFFEHLEICYLLKEKLESSFHKDLEEMKILLVKNLIFSKIYDVENKVNWLKEKNLILYTELETIKSNIFYRILRKIKFIT